MNARYRIAYRSYQQLDEPDARLLRILTLLVAIEYTPKVAAALLQIDHHSAFRHLERLAGAGLLESAGDRRYRLSDGMRAAVAEWLEAESAEVQYEARLRAIEWYATHLQHSDGGPQPEPDVLQLLASTGTGGE